MPPSRRKLRRDKLLTHLSAHPCLEPSPLPNTGLPTPPQYRPSLWKSLRRVGPGTPVPLRVRDPSLSSSVYSRIQIFRDHPRLTPLDTPRPLSVPSPSRPSTWTGRTDPGTGSYRGGQTTSRGPVPTRTSRPGRSAGPSTSSRPRDTYPPSVVTRLRGPLIRGPDRHGRTHPGCYGSTGGVPRRSRCPPGVGG